MFAPQIDVPRGEHRPVQVTVQLDREADVALLYVVPGRGAMLIYPADTTSRGFLTAGSHTLATKFAHAPADSVSPRGSRGRAAPAGAPPGGRTGMPRDTLPTVGDVQRTLAETPSSRGFLLLYLSDEQLSPAAIVRRVEGLSIPMDDTEALNTVTKLIRSTTGGAQRWDAYALNISR